MGATCAWAPARLLGAAAGSSPALDLDGCVRWTGRAGRSGARASTRGTRPSSGGPWRRRGPGTRRSGRTACGRDGGSCTTAAGAALGTAAARRCKSAAASAGFAVGNSSRSRPTRSRRTPTAAPAYSPGCKRNFVATARPTTAPSSRRPPRGFSALAVPRSPSTSAGSLPRRRTRRYGVEKKRAGGGPQDPDPGPMPGPCRPRPDPAHNRTRADRAYRRRPRVHARTPSLMRIGGSPGAPQEPRPRAHARTMPGPGRTQPDRAYRRRPRVHGSSQA